MLQALGHTCLIEPMLDLIRDAWSAPDLPRPSIYASNAAIAACARVGRMEEALDLHKDMVGLETLLSCASPAIVPFPGHLCPDEARSSNCPNLFFVAVLQGFPRQ